MDIYIKIAQFSFPFLSIAVIIIGWRAQRKSDKLKIVQAQLSQVRTEAYAGVYSFFFDLLRDVKTKRINDNEAKKRLMKIKETILSYGNDDVVQALSNWLRCANDNVSPYEQINMLGQLLLVIRKDMGYPNTRLTKDDLLLYIMQSSEELEKLKQN
jgi:hypothetical protein